MTNKLPKDMTDEELRVAANTVVGNAVWADGKIIYGSGPGAITLGAPKVRVLPPDTIEVSDYSDKGGLKLNQHINITGRLGKWIVVRVHEVQPGQPRRYDVGPLPNRKARKAHAARNKK